MQASTNNGVIHDVSVRLEERGVGVAAPEGSSPGVCPRQQRQMLQRLTADDTV